MQGSHSFRARGFPGGVIVVEASGIQIRDDVRQHRG